MTTICGHEREALIWALRLHADGVGDDDVVPEAEYVAVSEALHDPAKLAEIMAEELRRRGVAINNDTTKEDQVHAFVWHEAFTRTGIGVNVCDPNYRSWWPIEPKRIFLDTPQARAALLRILLLPEGTPITKVLDALEVS